MPLTQRQIQVIGQCLRAAAYGPFFPDGEFASIFGLARSEVAAVADQWPVVIDSAEHVKHAVGNSLNNLLGYPIKKERLAHLDDYLTVEPGELRDVFAAWRAEHL